MTREQLEARCAELEGVLRDLVKASNEVLTDNAQDEIEDPCGHSDRRPWLRIHQGVIPALRMSVQCARAALQPHPEHAMPTTRHPGYEPCPCGSGYMRAKDRDTCLGCSPKLLRTSSPGRSPTGVLVDGGAVERRWTETHLRMAVGCLTAELPALHNVEVPAVWEAFERCLALTAPHADSAQIQETRKGDTPC